MPCRAGSEAKAGPTLSTLHALHAPRSPRSAFAICNFKFAICRLCARRTTLHAPCSHASLSALPSPLFGPQHRFSQPR